MGHELDVQVAQALGYRIVLPPTEIWGKRPGLDGSEDVLFELPTYSANATGMMLLLSEMTALRYRWTICLEDEKTVSVDIRRNHCDDCHRNDGQSYKLATSVHGLPDVVAEAFVEAAK